MINRIEQSKKKKVVIIFTIVIVSLSILLASYYYPFVKTDGTGVFGSMEPIQVATGVDSDGSLHIAYVENSGELQNHYIKVDKNGKILLNENLYRSKNQISPDDYYPSLLVDQSDMVHILYGQDYYRLNKHGVVQKSLTPLFDDVSFKSSFSIDVNGYLHIIWNDGDLHYMKLDSDLMKVIPERIVSSDINEQGFAFIGIDANDRTHIIWNALGGYKFIILNDNADVINEGSIAYGYRGIKMDPSGVIHAAKNGETHTPSLEGITYLRMENNTIITDRFIERQNVTSRSIAIDLNGFGNSSIIWTENVTDTFYTRFSSSGNLITGPIRVSSIPDQKFMGEQQTISISPKDEAWVVGYAVEEYSNKSWWEGLHLLKIDSDGNPIVPLNKLVTFREG